MDGRGCVDHTIFGACDRCDMLCILSCGACGVVPCLRSCSRRFGVVHLAGCLWPETVHMPSPRNFFWSHATHLLRRCGRQPDGVSSQRSLYSAAPIADLIAPPLGANFWGIGCSRRHRNLPAMENQVKGMMSGGLDVSDLKNANTVGGGVGDTFGEDAATEEQPFTPWARIVASGLELLRDPRYNKGLAFTEVERDRHYLRGLLPPTVISQELQVERILENVRSYQNPLEKYIALMDLQERNERLFYKVLIDHVEELLPIVYTPVVGEACQKYGNIFRRPHGLYISLKDRGHVLELLKNWPEKNVEVIVVTDGERILGLGDLGLNGMGIPIGKLALYTALGGVRPSSTLPIAIDVGTNNEALLKNPFYIGLRQRRTTGQEYDELLHEFMIACKQAYGEKVLIQFEDFANHNAFRLLQKYATTHLVFNDDIQGTAAVALAGLVAALPITGGTLADHKFLFLGAGEAGTGIAEIIALEVSKQGKITVEEARKAIHLVDSKGLVTKSRYESLQEHKRPYAHEHPPAHDLLSAVKVLKPTVLIGTSGKGGTFTKEVLEEVSSYQDKPIIMALSNPTSQSECTAEEAYKYTKGKCIFASGSPFSPVTYEGKTYVIGQSNNCYIFPGMGLGCTISGAIRVHDDMFLAAAEALAKQINEEHLAKNQLYPAFNEIREISAHIGAAVAAKAYELGLATKLPQPKDLFAYAKSCMYSPNYRQYRKSLLPGATVPRPRL
ncbi:NADP-dependent malic enzyme isoform X3 [Physcomitrium patens]|nr:NADP-dependent malic enzyme-like isoform X3 [Physcomitrium patens]|eukprot:XP_024371400.1 NADP-dependent malic enzyme-like isoform X3 [Physcomitrella patens]